jgi:NADPH-dependent curcumin reductase CurA
MRDVSIPSYSPAFPLGSVINNQGISKIVKSNNPDFKEGELVVGSVGTENYSVVPKGQLASFVKVDNKYNLPLSKYISALGMPGLTA